MRCKARRREEFLAFAAQLPPCVMGLDACSASHYWARKLKELGHEPRVLAAEHVAPYRKSRKGKNDANDPEAILAKPLGGQTWGGFSQP